MPRIYQFAIVGVLGTLMFFSGGASPTATTATAPTRSDLPWHLADIWWYLDSEVKFESLSVDVDVLRDIPDSSQVYLCPMYGRLNKKAFYAGMLTNVPDVLDENRHFLSEIGRGVIFSRWETMDRQAIRQGPGSYYFTGDHEGRFISIRKKFEWTKGRYNMRLERLKGEVIGGSAFVWVGAFVKSLSRDPRTVFLGSLRFEGSELLLQTALAAFVEVYGDKKRPLLTIPPFRIAFGNLRVNDKDVAPNGIMVRYPSDVPQIAVVHSAELHSPSQGRGNAAIPMEKGSVVVEVGEEEVRKRGGVFRVAP